MMQSFACTMRLATLLKRMSTLTIQKNHDEAVGSLASLPPIVRFLFVPIRGRLSREQNRHSARVLKTEASRS
jgi:hypothetical protein